MASIEGPATEQLTTDTPNEASTLGSSWVQSLPEIPYADVISAHSVNAFVPLILVRELLPIMSDDNPGGKHVHPNMSKAALKMITETEAAEAWRSARVAMNTVDPGYMSAAPEFHAMTGGVMPIGWEDRAGRGQ